MSVGSFVLGGVGGGSTVALLVIEGFGAGGAAPAAAAVTGWVFKRRGRKYVTEVEGQRFVASSPEALEALVAQWRKTHPLPKPQQRKEVVPHPSVIERDRPKPDTATPPAIPAPGAGAAWNRFADEALAAAAQAHQADMALRALARQQAMQAAAAGAQREAAALAMQRAAEEESDIEALVAVLLEAA